MRCCAASATNVDLTINKDDINLLFDQVWPIFIFLFFYLFSPASQIINVLHGLNNEKSFRKFKENVFFAALKIE